MTTLLDTGPIVAYLYQGDTYHEWAKQEADRLLPPLLTREAVVSEVYEESRVFTVDSDFRVYQRGGTDAIPVLMQEE